MTHTNEARRRIESFLNMPEEDEPWWFWYHGLYLDSTGMPRRMRWYNRRLIALKLIWKQGIRKAIEMYRR